MRGGGTRREVDGITDGAPPLVQRGGGTKTVHSDFCWVR
jgi:hypothetical protein